jgi:hypothetical protein
VLIIVLAPARMGVVTGIEGTNGVCAERKMVFRNWLMQLWRLDKSRTGSREISKAGKMSSSKAICWTIPSCCVGGRVRGDGAALAFCPSQAFD